MEFISEQLTHYCELFSQSESPALQELNRETHLKVMSPRMLSGHLQGRFLSFMSKMMRPSYILEIGTYTGYSAICLAEGLAKNGQLITIDVNDETEAIAKKYVEKSGNSSKIKLITGNALDVIPTLEYTFDIVFIDADKRNYGNYFDLVIDKVRPGGIIIADNVLWSGKVLVPENTMDKDTLAIHTFNKKIQEDARIENNLLPLRDGLMMMLKK